ncbi:MAG: ECF transporter S component [Coriobacteriia bacterium]|nr:ECF transporter S component [Coriobacteriia bacterium]
MNSMSLSRKLVLMGLAAALAYATTLLIRIPIFGFLTYDPKDVIIVLAGFVIGPLAACATAVLVAALEMPISGTGPIGFVMNAAASCTFVGIATLIYWRTKTLKGVLIGVAAGGLAMVAVMLLLNYVLTPLYLGVSREQVVALMLPVLLPFNLIKGGVNAILILVWYKPFLMGLRAARLIDEEQVDEKKD